MINLHTFNKIDTVVCKIVANEKNASSFKNSFIDRPTFSEPNIKPIMENQINYKHNYEADINTARYYEICNGAIHESFSTNNDFKSDTEIIVQTKTNTSDDIIVVISDNIKHDELLKLYDKLKDRLKYIVHYGTSIDVNQIFEHFTQIISVDSLTKAVNKSYLIAKNGQTIFFPKVSSNFDFFGHINFA